MIKAHSDNITMKGCVEVSGEARDVTTELAVIIGGVFNWLKAKDPKEAAEYRLFLLMQFADPNSALLNLEPDDIHLEAGDVHEFDDGRGMLLGLVEIREPVQPLIGNGNHAHVGVDGAEGIVVRRNTCVGNGIKEGGLAHIGKTHDT